MCIRRNRLFDWENSRRDHVFIQAGSTSNAHAEYSASVLCLNLRIRTMYRQVSTRTIVLDSQTLVVAICIFDSCNDDLSNGPHLIDEHQEKLILGCLPFLYVQQDGQQEETTT